MISVKEKLPEHGQDVIVYNGGGVKTIASTYDAKEGRFSRYHNHYPGDRQIVFWYANVTHWQPFPEIPNNV